MKYIIILIIITFIMFVFVRAIGITEANECIKWEKQSQELVGFYLTDWQKSQCNR